MIVEIKTLDWFDRVLREQVYIAKSIGEALDIHAPDPASNAVFKITVLSKNEKDVDLLKSQDGERV